VDVVVAGLRQPEDRCAVASLRLKGRAERSDQKIQEMMGRRSHAKLLRPKISPRPPRMEKVLRELKQALIHERSI